jgi:hypothetical protein
MNEPTRISLNEAQIAEIKNRATHERTYYSRISIAMALEMLGRYEGREWYWPILDEIDQLEGVDRGCRTKPAEQFKNNGLLYPLWHKHYFTARHLVRNVGVRWSLDRDGNADLIRLCRSTQLPHIAHDLFVGGYSERAAARRLTGDWIVFGKYEGQNYYLGLSTHDEGAHADGKHLMDRLRQNCEAEFPFCFDEVST